MTTLLLTPANFLQSAISEVFATIKGWFVSYKDHKAERETYRTLSAMSDKDLRDIGISRGDIAAASRGENVRAGL